MIFNGSIAFASSTGGGLGGDGKGQEVVEVWSEPVSAYVRMNTDNELGWQEGNTFRKASYEVLIKRQAFDAKRVRIVKEGRNVGEYAVMNHDVLQAVGVVKIIV